MTSPGRPVYVPFVAPDLHRWLRQVSLPLRERPCACVLPPGASASPPLQPCPPSSPCTACMILSHGSMKVNNCNKGDPASPPSAHSDPNPPQSVDHPSRDHKVVAPGAHADTPRIWWNPMSDNFPKSDTAYTATPFCRGQSMPCSLVGSQVGH